MSKERTLLVVALVALVVASLVAVVLGVLLSRASSDSSSGKSDSTPGNNDSTSGSSDSMSSSGGSTSGSSNSTSGRQPNIVFILSDDQGFNDIGYRGSDVSTPHLDELARSGVRLDNYYVQPVCSPTRTQLMTGRYQIHTGLQHRIIRPSQPYGLPLEYPTIADRLRSAGYSTHAVGKWHLGFYTPEYTPLRRGFDTFFGILPGASNHYTYQTCDRFRNSTDTPDLSDPTTWCGYSLRDGDMPVATRGNTYSTRLYTKKAVNDIYSTHLYTEKAIEVVNTAALSEKPMFLYLAYQAPHTPMQAPKRYCQHIRNIENPKRRIYAGMLSAMDEGVKNLTEALQNAGLWENTILIFSSDNGGQVAFGSSNYPLRGVKATLWEGGIRTIGFVTSPLLSSDRKGKVSSALMHVSDWFPTILAMAGSKVNEDPGLDGVNQWSAIRDNAPSERDEILHNIDILSPLQGSPLYNDTFDTRVRAALRMGDFKLITGDPGDGSWYALPGAEDFVKKPFYSDFNATAQNLWLFNVAQDPNETVDLSTSMPDKVREMLDRLNEYNATSVPPWYPDSDPDCDPKLNGGVWRPWVVE